MKAIEVIQEALEEWSGKNTEESIHSRVFELLNSARDQVIIKMAGFSSSWSSGRWEVDHCNACTSAISELVRRMASEAVEEWVAANIKELPQMTPEMVEAFLADYKKVYEKELREKLCRLAKEQAMEDARQCVDEFVKKHGLPDVDLKKLDEEREPNWW